MALKWMDGSGNAAALYGVDIIVGQNGQTDIDWSGEPGAVPYIQGLHMIDVFRNGVLLQLDTYVEKTPTSIACIDGAMPLRKGDVISVRYRPSEVNMGDLKIVADYAELARIKHPILNQLVFVIANRKFYKRGINGWEAFVIPYTAQNIGVLFSYEKQSVTDVTQRTVRFETISYAVGSGNLLLFIDGRKVEPSDYTEVDNKTVCFHEDFPAGTSVLEALAANTDGWEDCYSHTVAYTYDAAHNVKDETVTYDGNVIKQTSYTYDGDGNVKTETVCKGYKTILKTYAYDEGGNVVGVKVEVS